MVAIASAFAMVVATPTAASAGSVTALAWLVRESGNSCGRAEFRYTYSANGAYYDIDVDPGYFFWDESRTTCGRWGEPYQPVLMWKGERFGGAFDWELFRNGEYSVFDGYEGSGYNNIRFRVCNMNTNTSYIGTCGSS
jgi:hypothetical protein